LIHRATLTYSAELVQRAAFSFWLRGIGWKALLTMVALMAVLAWEIHSGNRSWMVGAFGTLLLVGVGMVMVIFFGHLRHSLDNFRKLKVPKATFVVEDDGFSLTSEMGSSTMRWDAVYAIWKFDGFWLMLFSRNQFVTLPLADIPEQMREFILSRTSRIVG
jgi:hypothetical protein